MSSRSRFVRSLERLYNERLAAILPVEKDERIARERTFEAVKDAGRAALARLRGTEEDPLREKAGDA